MATSPKEFIQNFTNRTGSVQLSRTRIIDLGVQFVSVLVPIILVGIPIIWFVWASVWSGTPGISGEFSLNAYERIFTNPLIPSMLGNTLIAMFVGTSIALVIGLTVVVATNKFEIPGTSFIAVLLIVQYILPSLVLSIGWALLGGERGLVNELLILSGMVEKPVISITNEWGIGLALGVHYAGLVYLLVNGAVANVPRSMEETARVSGAAPLTVIKRITLSLSFPSIMIATILVLASTAQNFSAPLILGLPSNTYTISTFIYLKVAQFPNDFAIASSIGVLLMIFVVLALIAQWYIEGQSEGYQTIVGRGGSSEQAQFQVSDRAEVAVKGVLTAVGIVVVAPIIYIFATSFLQRATGFFSNYTVVTLENYHDLFFGVLADTFWSALGNTLFLAIVGSIFTMLLASIISYTIVKGKTALSEFLDVLVLAPIAIPLIIIGVAYLWFFLSYDILGLYGTIWLIIIAIASREIVYGTRAVNSSLQSIGNSLEEAARLSNANLLTIMYRIYFPLVKPGFFAGFMIAFIHYFKAFTRPVFLRGPDFHVLSTLLEATYSHGDTTLAVAIASIMAFFVASIAIVVEVFTDLSLTELS